MNRALVVVSAVVGLGAGALAQEADMTMQTSTTTAVAGQTDLTSELWSMEDATPIGLGKVDVRLTGRWVTGPGPSKDDDLIIEPSIVWGPCDNVEVSIAVPAWLGDAGDAGPNKDGNGDTRIGMLWRIMDQQDYWPAVALSGTARIPTGDGSSGIDGEFRVVLTNEYDSGIRSHVNAFAKSANGDNVANVRHFQWGAVVGIDGPLCEDGAVRWVADYVHRTNGRRGFGNVNLVELGWEWQVADVHKVGMSGLVGLDRDDDVPNFGAALTYAFSIVP